MEHLSLLQGNFSVHCQIRILSQQLRNLARIFDEKEVSSARISSPDFPSAGIHLGKPTLLFTFMVKPICLHTNTDYVAADRDRERRCLAAFIRAGRFCTSPSVSLMSGQSAAMEARSSLY